MNRLSWKYLLMGGIVVLALAVTAPEADAHGGSGGYCSQRRSSLGGVKVFPLHVSMANGSRGGD